VGKGNIVGTESKAAVRQPKTRSLIKQIIFVL
jgi:hypothetical protein